MKNLAAKLKTLDYKQVALEHGEKAALAVIVLLVFGLLAGTRWASYDKTPQELITKVNTAEEQIKNSTWPDDERQKFLPTSNVRRRVADLQSGLSVSAYALSAPMTFPVVKPQKPIEEPDWLPPENLIATASRAILALPAQSRSEQPVPAAEPAQPRPKANEPPPQFRQPQRGRRGDLEGELAAPVAAAPAMEFEDFDDGSGFGPALRNAAGEGVRFVALRAVVPLERQIRRVANAMNIPSAMDSGQAFDLVEYVDFVIERQTAIPGENPWSGAWEKVDISTSVRILNDVEDYAAEIVDSAIIDSVLTMPLPLRVYGQWSNEVTHPDIQDYQLSPAEIQQQLDLAESMVKMFREKQREMGPPRGGFSRLQTDLRRMGQETFGDRGARGLLSELEKTDPKLFASEFVKRRKAEATAAGKLLLFRYLDFDVEPGNAYRYRVRLVIRNPNFQTPVELLADHNTAVGQTRETPWSKPSPPVAVDPDVNYFLTRVDTRFRDVKQVRFDVFQWFKKAGTIVRSEVDTRIGQFIGMEKEMEVLRPGIPAYENEFVSMMTRDMLIDTAGGERFRADSIPDLKLPSTGISIPDEVLVLNRLGELVVMDIPPVNPDYDYMKQLDEWEKGPFKDIKDRSKEDLENRLDGLIEGDAGEMVGPRRRRSNPNRLRARSTDAF